MKQVHKRILTLLLAFLLALGMMPMTALGATREGIADVTYDPNARLLSAAELSELTTAALAGKQSVDLRTAASQSMESLDAPHYTGYAEGIALELTEKVGLVGFEDDSATDELYAFIWLQELPDALERQMPSIMGYADVASEADQARETIKSMGAVSARGRSASTIIIEYEYFEVFAGFAVRTDKSTLEQIAALPGVYAVTEVEYYAMDYIQDPGYNTPGNAGAREVMDIDALHAAGIDGTGVKVGVIDSGIDATHPDLIGAYKGGWNFADDTSDMTMQDGSHGTHVSGTIASQGEISLGVAPGVELYMAQVFSQSNHNSASAADITAALEAFTAGDADKGIPKVDIINMSLGNESNTAYSADHYARNNAVIAGVLIVNSAGNNAYPESNTTDRRNYTLGSGGVSLPLSVAAAKYGGDPMFGYNLSASNAAGAAGTVFAVSENGDASLSGLFVNGSFGSGEPLTVTFDATNTGGSSAWLDAAYYGTYDRQPLVYVEGMGYEIHYACATTGDMSNDELTALKALPKDKLIGKILVVNRGQDFTSYLGEALRLGAGAVIILNRDPSPIGNLNIGNVAAAAMPVFSGPVAGKQALLDAILGGTPVYLNPGDVQKLQHSFEPADFSSIGPVNETAQIKPDVTGPGWSILSTSLNGTYEKMSGTSMSSPWVAGVAALVKQQYPSATPAEIKARIMDTADKTLLNPLSSRLSNPNYYFNASGTEISVFEQGSGYVDPQRAVYEETYITVANDDIPTGNTDKSVMTADMGSFSFGQTEPDTQSKKLTATVHGGTVEGIEVVYNRDTRYSNENLGGAVEVFYTDNGSSFDVWLEIADNANTDWKNGGNLYEGYILVTAGGKQYVLPWATRVGDSAPPESDFWLLYADRPVQATYNAAKQDFSPYSSQNYIYFMFEGKTIADSVWLDVVGDDAQGYTYTMCVYLISAPMPALAYCIPITLAEGVKSSAYKLSDFIDLNATYYIQIPAKAHALKGGAWEAAPSAIKAGSYNLSFAIGTSYKWYRWNGITFTGTRPTLTVEEHTFTRSSATFHEFAYAAQEATINGRIYSAGLAEAAACGFMWAGLHTLYDDEIYYLDQSYNVLMDAGAGKVCVLNDKVGPYICDAEGNFSLTFPLQAGLSRFFPADFCSSGVVYATDAFDLSRTDPGYAAYYGCLASYQWKPLTYRAAPEVTVISAELTNGKLTAQFKMEDGRIPVMLDARKLTASLFKDGVLDRALTRFHYNRATGVATWTFTPYAAKSVTPWKLTATVAYKGKYIETSVSSNEVASAALERLSAKASIKTLRGNKNELTIVVTEYYTDGSAKNCKKTFIINKNAVGTYAVDVYKVYVSTKDNKVRECYIVT